VKMSSTKIIGYAALAMGGPLEPFEYDPPMLGDNDVRVSVSHCGLCHTDIQAIDEFYDIGYKYPFVPGHEIVGYVSQVGNAVSSLKEGDRVGIGWQGRSCMQCEYCLMGEEQLCRDIVDSATWYPYGGFSTSVVADYRFAYPLPEAMLSEVAAVLMCAGITVYKPLRAYSGQPSQKLAIMGVGGLGHIAIQFAHALGYDVTVFSSSPDKQGQARAWGADAFVVSSDQDEFRKHIFYFDLVLCTAPGKIDWNILLNIPKKAGRVILVSFPDMTMNPTDLVAHDLSITGSFIGNRATMREMLAFAQANHITPMLETMPMPKVNEAIQRVRENKARYRVVMVNEAAGG
jgi:alcohol/geraniol dehydrogenase (NADP+)